MYQQPAEPPMPEEQPTEAVGSGLASDSVASGCTASGYTAAAGSDCVDCVTRGIAWRPKGLFVGAEYNMWWTKSRSTPPLVTTSPAGTAQLDVGVLPDAQLLYGGGTDGGGLGHGGRLTVGQWLGDYETVALVGRFTGFATDDASFSAVSDGTTNLAIPFFDAQFGIENAYLVAFTPDGTNPFANGNVNVNGRLDMTAVDAYAQFLLYEEYGTRFDFIGGYQMLRLDSSLNIDSTLVSQNVAIVSPVGTSIFVEDIFEGRNEFHGGQLGLSTTIEYGCWNFSMLGKIGVGNMRQSMHIDGNTVITPPAGAVDVRDEGLFALGTNQGVYSRDRVAYIPEVGVKLGYKIRPNLNLTLGYTFLYISNVVHGGDAIDRQLNLSQTNGGPAVGPNQNRPMFLGFRETDFWAQGLNFGLEYKF
jgi:hypothetical protein